MTSRNRSFAVGTVLATLIIPTALIFLSPFESARNVFGVSWGWGLALAVIVPSFMAMSRLIESDDDRRIQARFMYTMMARFAASVVGVALFAVLVKEPPLYDFVLAFFLGFAVLSALDLTFLLSKSPDRNHA